MCNHLNAFMTVRFFPLKSTCRLIARVGPHKSSAPRYIDIKTRLLLQMCRSWGLSPFSEGFHASGIQLWNYHKSKRSRVDANKLAKSFVQVVTKKCKHSRQISPLLFSLYKCFSVLYKQLAQKLLTTGIWCHVNGHKFTNGVDETEPCISARKTVRRLFETPSSIASLTYPNPMLSIYPRTLSLTLLILLPGE
jgi:hypothetical protein